MAFDLLVQGEYKESPLTLHLCRNEGDGDIEIRLDEILIGFFAKNNGCFYKASVYGEDAEKVRKAGFTLGEDNCIKEAF